MSIVLEAPPLETESDDSVAAADEAIESGKTYWVLRLGARSGGPVAGGGLDRAMLEMRGKVRLWNMLVELDRAYREQVRLALTSLAPELIAAATAVTVASETAARREAAAHYRATFKTARDEPAVTTRLEALEAERKAASNKAGRESGLYWCNSDDVLARYRRARPALDAWTLAGVDAPPGVRGLRFHAWRNERGSVTVRFQTGLPVAEAWGQDTRLRIAPVPEDAWSNPVEGERRRRQRTTLSLRVGSEGRRPIWLDVPIVLDRPLPPDSLIRTAGVFRDKVGLDERWSAVLTIELPRSTAPAPLARGPVVGIDVGWRLLEGGLRVCVWRGSDGTQGELSLPPRWLAGMQRTEDLRSIRDERFNVQRAQLVAWLATHRPVPDWLKEATATLAQWRSPARLAALALRWRQERWPGDGSGFEPLEAWRKRDKHLLNYEANLRDRLLANRRYVYRGFASDLASRAGEVRLERFKLDRVARRPKAGETDESWQASRHQRVLAAVSDLRLAIVGACRKRGVTVVEVPAEYTTQTCAVCGTREHFDAAAELVHRCSNCGAIWDQDMNGAINLMRGGVSPQIS